MVQTSLNMFDMIVLGIMALSCLFAFFRGFVREVLSLGAWIGAGLVTLYMFPTAADHLEPHFKNPIVAAGVGTLGIYIAALIGFSIINRLLLQFIKSGSDVGMLDNLFGLLFGAFRGAFIISLAYFLMSKALASSEYPDWLMKSQTRPYVEKGAQILVRVAPEYLQEISLLQQKATDGEDQKVKIINKESGSGYSRESSQQLERLIQGFSKPEE